jgi:hypothetical protein
MLNLETIIEHLQETGEVVVTNISDIKKLQAELKLRGFETEFISTDRDYLKLK